MTKRNIKHLDYQKRRGVYGKMLPKCVAVDSCITDFNNLDFLSENYIENCIIIYNQAYELYTQMIGVEIQHDVYSSVHAHCGRLTNEVSDILTAIDKSIESKKSLDTSHKLIITI